MPFLCPTCDARYETDLGSCPKDGDHLVPFKDPEGLVGKVVDGRFEVKRLLGRGGMGSVYLAHQRSVDRLVALNARPGVRSRHMTSRPGVLTGGWCP
jgi:hypothetical protein